jgi:hypothetical protein
MIKGIALEEKEINILVDLVSKKLLAMQDELEKEPKIKPTVALFWDLYMKLLKSSTMPGARCSENPYRDCDDCNTCGHYENGRCTHIPKGVYLPCKYWVRKG